jgi:hypothetical protein
MTRAHAPRVDPALVSPWKAEGLLSANYTSTSCRSSTSCAAVSEYFCSSLHPCVNRKKKHQQQQQYATGSTAGTLAPPQSAQLSVFGPVKFERSIRRTNQDGLGKD